MAKEADPAEIIATIRASIEVSPRGSRRIRAHRFRELGYGEEEEAAGFGFAAAAVRKGKIDRLTAK